MDRKEFLIKALESIKTSQNFKQVCKIIVVKNFVDEKIDKIISRMVSLNFYSSKFGLGQKIAEIIDFVDEDEMIAFLEDDDLFFEEKINRIIDVLSVNVNTYFYHNAFISIDLNGNYLSIYKNRIIRFKNLNNSAKTNQIFQAISNGGAHNLSSIAIRSSLIKSHVTLISKINNTLDRVLFLLSLESGNNMYFDNKVLTKYRIHNNNSRPSFLETDYLSIKYRFIQNAKKELNHVREVLHNPTSLKIADYFILEIRIHEWFVSPNETPILSWRDILSIAIISIHNGKSILFLLIIVVTMGKLFRFNDKIKRKIYKFGASAL